MRVSDYWLLGAGSLLGLVLWFQGYQSGFGAAQARGAGAGERAILAPGGQVSLPTLPAGLRVDPATGLLMGVVPPDIPGVAPLTWELLRTYAYQPGLEGLPDSIRDLDAKRVVMIGFLMTIFEFDDIREFHLVANHWSCCFGYPAGLDGSLSVKLAAAESGLPNTMKPLRVIGTLRVGEVKVSGIVYAIYSLEDAEVRILDF